MATKLKLVLQNPKLRLAFKALAFAGLIILLRFQNFNLVSIALFAAGAIFLYIKPLFRTFELLLPFAVLAVVALLITNLIAWGVYFWIAVIYFTALFFILLGIKDLVVVRREFWRRFLNLALIYPVFLLFFFQNETSYGIKILLLFLALLILLKELLKKRLPTWVLALFLIEGVWAIALLPLGFISAANLAVLTYWTLTEFAINYQTGLLTRHRVLTHATIFVVLLVLIFAFSKWSL